MAKTPFTFFCKKSYSEKIHKICRKIRVPEPFFNKNFEIYIMQYYLKRVSRTGVFCEFCELLWQNKSG